MAWWSFREWRRRRVLQRHALPQAIWHATVAALPLLDGLSEAELARLRDLVVLFAHEKQIVAAGDGPLEEVLRLRIAAQACLPILNLGLDFYAGWVAVIVYPDEFVPEYEYTDEDGVVHHAHEPMIGEAWERGPVILSAADAERSGEHDGVNVVIHEFAHKLDMLNGAMDGLPMLHPDMRVADWANTFTLAYENFCARLEAGETVEIDPYAAESPAEFFAVMSEAFFEVPLVLQQAYPAVYRQLAAFYRQDPAVRQNTI